MSSTPRKKVITYEPKFAGWVTNHLAEFHWRIKATIPFEEAQQEAHLVFLKVRRRYPEAEGPHLMRLFQTSWLNRFTDLSREDSKERSNARLSSLSPSTIEEQVGDTDNEGLLGVKIRQAPEEVRMVLALFLGAPQQVLSTFLGEKGDTPHNSYKHGGSERINKLLGFPIEQNTIKKVIDYFKS